MPGLQKCKGNKKRNEWQKKALRAEKINSELKEKGHEPSRAELKIPRLEPARLGLITTVPMVSFSSCQRNLIKTFQIEGMITLIKKMTLIFSSDLLNGQK